MNKLADFWKDVQALVGRGFINRRQSVHMLMKVDDVDRARAWLAEGSPDRGPKIAVTTDVPGRRDDQGDNSDPFLQIAFTPSGLRRFGAPPYVLEEFPDPFLSGMAPPPQDGADTSRRAGILGDVGENHERHWLWGGRNGGVRWDDIHALVMVLAEDMDAAREEQRRILADSGMSLAGPVDIATLQTQLFLQHDRDIHPSEHFGFLDGVSQPLIKGMPLAEEKGRRLPETYALHAVAPGEFVLGQMNERKIVTPYPKTKAFGLNGSYLVVRQMDQNVAAFNRLVERTAGKLSGQTTIDAKEHAAAKLMGRYRNGWPLSPHHGPPADPTGKVEKPEDRTTPHFPNDYGFAHRDAGGLSCPISAHIRRANPRDSREEPPETALRLSKRHRILRRGRVYGPDPSNENFDANDDDQARGLLFICLNADIAQQFEFVQQTWLNNHFFGGADGEVDPIVAGLENDERPFSIPGRPQVTKVARSSALTRIRGGGYFFLPGRRGLAQLISGDWPPVSR